MFKRLVYFIPFIIVFSLVGTAAGWTGVNVGDEAAIGTSSYDAATSTWTIKGSGNDIWNNADDFFYEYKYLKGDGSITARVVSIGGPGTDEWRKAGVMMRETLSGELTAGGSTHATMIMTPTVGHGASFQRRLVRDGGSSNTDATPALPYWVRVVRQGDSFSGYISPDGTTWTQVGSAQTIAMRGRGGYVGCYIGLCVTSHTAGVLCESKLDNVILTGDITDTPPPMLKASNPSPTDAATGVIFPMVTWTPGDTAEYHDVYFGTTPTLGPADKKPPRLPKTYLFYYHTGTITPGQTYYWRIDEVESNGTTIHTGDVWSFTAAPLTAYSPTPVNGARWIPAAGLSLTWYPGANAQSHDVYFGTNKADVDAGTGGTAKGNQFGTTYIPTGLADKTTYYWRVDEHSDATYRGETWSFQTSGPGGGVKGQYFNNMDLSGNPALTRIDSNINFTWGDPGSPDPVIGVNNFSARWSAELEVAFTGTYTFITTSDDGARLWVNNQLVVNSWIDQGATDHSGTINLVAGQSYQLVMEYYENGGGATAILSWQGPNTPRQVIPSGPLQVPVHASGPIPGNGAVNVKQTPKLQWNSGDKAAQHDIYFGTDQAAVTNATTTTAGIYKTRQNKDITSYPPGTLEWNTTYYWRIDEVNTAAGADSPWKGSTWSFTTADFIIVDDFEDYNDFTNVIYLTWIDGYGSPSQGIPGNGSGSTVGNLDAPYAEPTITHGGSGQSMPMGYDDSKLPYYSEAVRTWATGQNWTVNNVKALTIWFRGRPAPGTFVEGPTGTYKMTASGADIWDIGSAAAGYHDEFNYAFKMLNGDGSIQLKVESIENTNGWAKGGVMIRESLDPCSPQANVSVTPSNGVAFQYRTTLGGTSTNSVQRTGVTAPYWVRITRTGTTLKGECSADGVTWSSINAADATTSSTTIAMAANVYIGIALTSHDAFRTCHATFSNVTTVGATGVWMSQDISVGTNDPDPVYVTLEGTSGTKTVIHTDPNAAQLSAAWQEWNIPLSAFTGVSLNSVKKMYIGTGTKGGTKKGGIGKVYIDDIRVYKSRCVPLMAKPTGDINNDCVVDYMDLDTMTNQWLQVIPPATTLSADLNTDKKVDLKDYVVLASTWLEEKLWP